jgi:predicted RNA-binding Zn ribbon-like protein
MDELADRFPPLIGNAMCLDFTNTLEPAAGRDHLNGDYSQLVAWAEHAGLVDPNLGARLRRRAQTTPEAAAAVLKEAVRLRSAIFGVFAAVATGVSPTEGDLAVVRDGYATTIRAALLQPTADGLRWAWPAITDDDPAVELLAWPLWPIAASAAELATSSNQLRRVKVCAGEGCDWLFVDTSKNRSRRWCLMRYCGNVGKSHRQAARRRVTRAQARVAPGGKP